MSDTGVIGIDKLVLATKEFSLKTMPPMVLHNTKPYGEEESLLAVTQDGRRIQASRIYVPTDRLEVCSNISINRYGLNVSLNPNKAFHDYHQAEGVGHIEETLKNVQKELKEFGVSTDMKHHNISRIDVARDNSMTESYDTYKPLYDTLRARQMQATQYTTGVEVGNRSRSVVFYDKGEDVKRRTGEIISESNLVRGEVRLKNTKKVKSSTYFNTTSNLVKYVDHVPTVYKKEMDNVLKGLKIMSEDDQIIIPFDDDITLFNQVIKTHRRDHALNFLSMFGGIGYVLEKYGSLQEFEVNVLSRVEFRNRQARRKVTQQIRDLYHKSKMIGGILNKRQEQLKHLSQEMLLKFVG